MSHLIHRGSAAYVILYIFILAALTGCQNRSCSKDTRIEVLTRSPWKIDIASTHNILKEFNIADPLKVIADNMYQIRFLKNGELKTESFTGKVIRTGTWNFHDNGIIVSLPDPNGISVLEENWDWEDGQIAADNGPAFSYYSQYDAQPAIQGRWEFDKEYAKQAISRAMKQAGETLPVDEKEYLEKLIDSSQLEYRFSNDQSAVLIQNMNGADKAESTSASWRQSGNQILVVFRKKIDNQLQLAGEKLFEFKDGKLLHTDIRGVPWLFVRAQKRKAE